ncbi:MAG: M81 family metallopeptidase [Terrimicrobiaceae bacterium]|nr:M81 family metallopeptidase [Terrimicrobiaceae bacterium]
MDRPRIAIAGFQHETNSFAPFGTDFDEFEKADGWPALTKGAAIIEVFRPLNIPIGGFLRSDEIEPAPTIWASAEPAGPVTDAAFDWISGAICEGIASAPGLAGVFLDLHGAMVTQSHEDGEGELLERIREITGPDLPIVVSLDMHANITAKMVDLSDAITIYRTYPHIDMIETGARCRELLLRRIISGRPLRKAFRKLPFLIPLSAQCTDAEPFRSLYGSLRSRTAATVLSADIGAGFPAADIFECGPAVVIYGLDQTAVDETADRLRDDLLAAEGAFDNRLFPVGEAVAHAARKGCPGRPVVLADVQDNPGCGGTSDTTGLLRALVDAHACKAALGLIWDPEIAAAAHAAGVGAELTTQLGSRFGYDAVPFRGTFRIEALSDGEIEGTGAIFNGGTMSLGRMAHLKVLDGDCDVRVVVSSNRFQCLDLALFRALGIEPLEQSILAVKSTVHFRADFEPIAAEILMVESPGANPCRNSSFPYRNLRQGVRLDLGAWVQPQIFGKY